ncbi:hypothetical protein NE857_03425 [Nocardiopsis exhalans]|uniref:Lipoprotein n=1 Tax=Nocardiopsis exhalans TaxID=163604 RepID=A0ABY5DAG1_9ACTN|nr:hypothetical protein [Nocardiopsis exhalans]USY20721.1 hypothetical protein NE857_03425 [Nocardiopsis exhalans]
MRRVVCAVLVVALAGCAAPEEEPEQTEASTPLAAPSNPGPSPQEEAVEAYRSMWGVVVEGSHEGSVAHPDLEKYASGQALELVTAMLQGIEATGEPVLTPHAVIVESGADSTEVSIEDCIDSSQWLVGDGSEGSSQGERKRPVEAIVLDQGDGWRVDDLWLGEYGSC